MGVQRLWSWSKEKQQRDLLYEPTDLVDFRGKRIIIDAASFHHWVYENVMAKRDMYYLGDYGPDVVAANRYFIQSFFIDYGIHTVWVHDGSFNPAKVATQMSRRAERVAPAADLISRLFACLRSAPRAWSPNESFLTVAKEVSKGLKEMDCWMEGCTGCDDSLYMLLDELAAASQQVGGPSLTHVRTILEADAYIAAQCLEQGFDAVMSSDTDFLVLDCPWIPLDFVQHRSGPDSCPCKFVPKGRFSEVMYNAALQSLQPLLRTVMFQGNYVGAHSLTGFRRLLPDLACLLGNDFFFPTDPLSGQSKGFVKKVTIPLIGVQPSDRMGETKVPAVVTVTCDLASHDKVQCARFLLVCLINGWVEEISGVLDLTGSCSATSSPKSKKRSSASESSSFSSSSPLAALLFPNAHRRLQGYLTARDQYKLESSMAKNRMPTILVDAGIAAQYATCRSRSHYASFLCHSGVDDDDGDDNDDDEEDEEDEGEDGEGKASKRGTDSKELTENPRSCTLAFLLPMQRFQFPMLNLTSQRQMMYELLFYRALKGEETALQPGMISVVEEYVRINQNTGKVDLRHPFRSVRVDLFCEDEIEGSNDMERKDWRLSQSKRVERYKQHGPNFYLHPLESRLAFFLALLGYSQGLDGELRDAVDIVMQKTLEEKESGENELRDEVLAFVLSLRVLIVAYGADSGLSLSDPPQQNYDAYRALLFAAASTLLEWGEEMMPVSIIFDPTARGVRPSYPSWVTDEEEGVTPAARLRGIAFLICYRVCLRDVLELSDILGRVLHLRRPLALDLSHIYVQRFVGGKWNALEQNTSGINEGRLLDVARALEHAVLLGISDEMAVWYGKGIAQEESKRKK
ncbi:Hypothetical protein NocV09_11300010 [Nannochloropsis oceanica]